MVASNVFCQNLEEASFQDIISSLYALQIIWSERCWCLNCKKLVTQQSLMCKLKISFFLSYCQLQCKALKTKIYTFSDLKLVACNCNDHMKKFFRYFGFRRLENQITLFTVPCGHLDLNLTSVWEQKLFTGFFKGETVMIMNTRTR